MTAIITTVLHHGIVQHVFEEEPSAISHIYRAVQRVQQTATVDWRATACSSCFGKVAILGGVKQIHNFG